MSNFSGKCDLYDHISMEKMYPKEDNPNILVSDIMECFNIFKERTGGVIYQFTDIEVNEFNYMLTNVGKDIVKVEHKKEVKDKRCKEGVREVIYYTYRVSDCEFNSIEDLKKAYPLSILREIHFDTLLDIIPYFPYVIGVCASDMDGEYVVLSRRSFVDEEEDSLMRIGLKSTMTNIYRKELQNFYLEAIEKYKIKKGE